MQGSHWFALLYWPRYCQCFCRTEGKTTETFDPEHRLSGHVPEEWDISLQLTDKLACSMYAPKLASFQVNILIDGILSSKHSYRYHPFYAKRGETESHMHQLPCTLQRLFVSTYTVADLCFAWSILCQLG